MRKGETLGFARICLSYLLAASLAIPPCTLKLAFAEDEASQAPGSDRAPTYRDFEGASENLDLNDWLETQKAISNGWIPPADRDEPLSEEDIAQVEQEVESARAAYFDAIQDPENTLLGQFEKRRRELELIPELVVRLRQYYLELYQGRQAEHREKGKITEIETPAERLAYKSAEERMENLITKGWIEVFIPGVAKVDLTRIGPKNQVIAIQFSGDETSYLIFDEEVVSIDHWRSVQYIARKHLLAGKTRSDGQKGRDVFAIGLHTEGKGVLWSENPRVTSLREFKRPERFSEKVVEYGFSIAAAPNSGDLMMAATMTPVLAGVSALMSASQVWVHPDLYPHMRWEPALLSILFTFPLSLFQTTLRNWEAMNPKTRLLKSFSVSVLFAGTLVSWMQQSPAALLELKNLNKVLVSSAVNSVSKMLINLRAAIRSDRRKSTMPIEVAIPGTRKSITFNRANYEMQRDYVANSFVPKMMYITDYRVPVAGIDIPLGGLILVGTSVKHYFQGRSAAKKSGDMEAVRLYDAHVKDLFNPVNWWRSARALCQDFLTKGK